MKWKNDLSWLYVRASVDHEPQSDVNFKCWCERTKKIQEKIFESEITKNQNWIWKKIQFFSHHDLLTFFFCCRSGKNEWMKKNSNAYYKITFFFWKIFLWFYTHTLSIYIWWWLWCLHLDRCYSSFYKWFVIQSHHHHHHHHLKR